MLTYTESIGTKLGAKQCVFMKVDAKPLSFDVGMYKVQDVQNINLSIPGVRAEFDFSNNEAGWCYQFRLKYLICHGIKTKLFLQI